MVFLLVYWVFFIHSLSSHPIQYYFEPLREWQHKYFMSPPPIHVYHCLREKRNLGPARCFNERWFCPCKPYELSSVRRIHINVEEENQLSSVTSDLHVYPWLVSHSHYAHELNDSGKGDREMVILTAHWPQPNRFLFPPNSFQIPKLHFLSLSKGSSGEMWEY